MVSEHPLIRTAQNDRTIFWENAFDLYFEFLVWLLPHLLIFRQMILPLLFFRNQQSACFLLVSFCDFCFLFYFDRCSCIPCLPVKRLVCLPSPLCILALLPLLSVPDRFVLFITVPAIPLVCFATGMTLCFIIGLESLPFCRFALFARFLFAVLCTDPVACFKDSDFFFAPWSAFWSHFALDIFEELSCHPSLFYSKWKDKY